MNDDSGAAFDSDAGFAKWIPTAAVVIFYLLLAHIRVQFLDMPLGRNEGTYGYMGQQMLLGAVPFSDFYEMKPTGLYFAYASLIAVFGSTASGMHLGLLSLNLATGLCLYSIATRLWDRWAAAIVAVTFGWLTLHPWIMGLALDAEHIIVLLFCLAGLLILKSNQRLSFVYLVGAGALGGFCIAIKQTSVLIVLALALWIVCDRNLLRRRSGPIATALLAYLAGTAGVIALLLAYHLAQGNLADLWYWTYTFPANFYAVEVSLDEGWARFRICERMTIRPYIGFYAFGLLGASLALFRSRTHRMQSFSLLVFFGASGLVVLPGFRFYGHYFLFLIPGLCLFIGLSFHLATSSVLSRWSSGQSAEKIHLVTLLLYIALATMGIAKSDWNYFGPDLDATTQRVYGSNPFSEIDRIAADLKQRMVASDDVVVFGSEPQLYLALGVEAPGHQIFATYLAKKHPKKDEMLRDYKSLVESNPPRFAVMVEHPFSWTLAPDDDHEFYRWAKQLLSVHYKPLSIAEIYPKEETIWVRGDDVRGFVPRTKLSVTLYERIRRECG